MIWDTVALIGCHFNDYSNAEEQLISGAIRKK